MADVAGGGGGGGVDRVYLCVDFEACDGIGTWIAASVGLFREGSSSGGIGGVPAQLLDSAEFYVQRPLDAYDAQRRHFWLDCNAAAHAYIVHQAQKTVATSLDDKERAFCAFVRTAHERYPFLKVVSDNPQFDLGVSNTILRRHGLPDINTRANGAWLHPVCTFSFALAAQQLSLEWWEAPRPRCPLQQRAFQYPNHTPLHDMCVIMSNYFHARHMVRSISRHRQPPLLHGRSHRQHQSVYP